jgi:hypothetical protein
MQRADLIRARCQQSVSCCSALNTTRTGKTEYRNGRTRKAGRIALDNRFARQRTLVRGAYYVAAANRAFVRLNSETERHKHSREGAATASQQTGTG